MLTEKATVIEVKDNTLWLQTQVKTTCGSCQHKDSCGTSAVAKAFSPKPNVIGVPFDSSKFGEVVAGDRALIGVQEGFIVRSAMYVYLLPIVGFLLLALLAESLISAGIVSLSGNGAEAFRAFFAFAGGFMGYGFARRLVAKMGGGVSPSDVESSDDPLSCDTHQKIHVLQVERGEEVK